MPSSLLIILIPVVIVIIAIAAYYGYLAEKKRREALAAFAAELGWSFNPSRDRSHDDEYAHFEVFRHVGNGELTFL